MEVRRTDRFRSFHFPLYITFRHFRDEAAGSQDIITQRIMLERGFAGFRFGRFRRLFIVGRITFIRRRSSMQGTCLAARRSILADLQRQTIDHDGCRSHTIRLDDANSRIFGVINIPQTICIHMIANQNIMFGIEDISNSAADFFFQHIVSLIRYTDDATMNFDRCNDSYDNRHYFAVIGITSDASIGIQFYAFGLFFERQLSLWSASGSIVSPRRPNGVPSLLGTVGEEGGRKKRGG